MFDVEAPRRDIRRDEQLGRAVAEALHDAISLFLREAAMERLGPVAAPNERLGQLVDFCAGAAEHDRRRRTLHVQNAAERRQLVLPRHNVRHLPNARRASRRNGLARDADAHGVLEVLFGDLGDAWRDGRGKQSGLPFGGKRVEDLLEIISETHVEHLVRLVEHDDLHPAEGE